MRQQHELLAVESYELEITVDPAAIACRTVIHFRCHQPGTTVFADLAATQVDSVIVNGRAVDVADNWDGSRLTVPNVATSNVGPVRLLSVRSGAAVRKLPGACPGTTSGGWHLSARR